MTTVIGPAFIKRPWTKQPPAGTPIDLSNPLTNGLGFCYGGAQGGSVGRDSVSGVVGVRQSVTDSDDLRAIATEKGMALRGSESFAGTDDYYLEFLVPDIPGAGTAVTIVMLFRQGNNTDDWQTALLAYDGVATATANVNHLVYSRVNSSEVRYYSENAGDQWTGPSLVLDEWTTIGYSRQSGVSTTGQFYTNGVATATGQPAGTATQNTITRVHLLGDAAFATEACAGDLAFAAIWMRELNAFEHKALADNPWQIFKPRNIFVGKPDALNQRLVMF